MSRSRSNNPPPRLDPALAIPATFATVFYCQPTMGGVRVLYGVDMGAQPNVYHGGFLMPADGARALGLMLVAMTEPVPPPANDLTK